MTSGVVDVEIGWHDVVVARQDHRLAQLQQTVSVLVEPLEQASL